MSINPGAPVNDLPAPPTGGGIQSFIDVYGEVWVALWSAHGGQWRKARDVLHAVAYRANPVNNGTASPGTVVAYGGTVQDAYGLLDVPSNSFIVPIAGWYWIQATANGLSTAIGTYIQGEIYQNAAQVTSLNKSSPLVGGGLSWSSSLDLYCNALDQITCRTYQSGAVSGLQTGQSNTRLEISYQGTG